MLCAVAAASPATTSLARTKMANADVVVIQAIAPANLAWKRGDISVFLSVIKQLNLCSYSFSLRKGCYRILGRNPRTSTLSSAFPSHFSFICGLL
jgi:hypothetical protein